MDCPICHRAMEPGSVKLRTLGGFMSSRTTLTWYPRKASEKRGLDAILPAVGKQLSVISGMQSETCPDAWYCPACGHVMALFSADP
ncbi:PF20097 family protein [Pseudoflavonifractor hominis]|uniref:DUF6487 domain-containing protein n=1 Tax=Pseudoflavonifractor hominis TaxID=2763059 RepID=A0ABR7HPQ6_9FIRM|nr:PF20097 family protein [Pseudoflavonifractor hominis]MBC5729505.1 hypothetical protein [Pseudoflavonifractor hominis]